MEVIESFGEDDTYRLGERIGREAKAGDVYLLDGDLGVGKTVFAKGVAAGLDIDEPVTSPTFTIVHEYEGRLKLYHFDVYRIGDPDEMWDIGFDEYLYGDGVCLIEWPEKIAEILPEDCIKVSITTNPDLSRTIEIS